MKLKDFENDGLTIINIVGGVKRNKQNLWMLKLKFYHPNDGEFLRTITSKDYGPLQELIDDFKSRR